MCGCIECVYVCVGVGGKGWGRGGEGEFGLGIGFNHTQGGNLAMGCLPGIAWVPCVGMKLEKEDCL